MTVTLDECGRVGSINDRETGEQKKTTFIVLTTDEKNMKKSMHVCLDLATPSTRDPRWDGENPPLYVLVYQADGECLRQKMDEIIG
jgi:hypothetical protein